jgi:hypothetical protein
MLNLQLITVYLLLNTASVILAADKNAKQRIYCPMTQCPFSENDGVRITELVCPPFAQWLDDRWRMFDQVDSLIFKGQILPYRSVDIREMLDEEVYVMTDSYKPLQDNALINIQSRKKYLEEQLCLQTESHQTGQKELIQSALDRVTDYMQMIKSIMYPGHPCIGATVTRKSIASTLLWAKLKQ